MLTQTYQDEYKTERQKILKSYYSDLFELLSTHLGEQDADKFLSNLGLPNQKEMLNGPSLSFTQYFKLLGCLECQHPVAGIGLEIGRMKTIKNFGIYGYALLSSSTYSQFTAVADRIFYAIYENVSISHKVEGDYLYISYIPNQHVLGRGYITLMEQVVMCGVSLMSAQLPKDNSWQSCFINCNYQQPEYHEEYRKYFSGKVFFDQPVMQLCVPASWMNLELTSGDSYIASMCAKKFEALLGHYAPDDSYAGKVKHILMSGNFNQLPSLGKISEHFHMAERTLRQKLAAEETSFRQILNEVRHELAKRYLYSSDLSIQEIAFSLGYTHPQNFYRAFTKIEQMTPENFRLTNRSFSV